MSPVVPVTPSEQTQILPGKYAAPVIHSGSPEQVSPSPVPLQQATHSCWTLGPHGDSTHPNTVTRLRLMGSGVNDVKICQPTPAELSYKILFAVLAVANHICGVIVYGWDVHRYLTYISSLATTLAKVLSLSELFVSYRFKDIAEHHWFRETTNYFQVLTSVVEAIVFSFYWSVLAYKNYVYDDLSTEDHILNITMHVMCPIIAITPVFLERTDFGLKQLAGVFTAGIIYLGYMVSYAVRTDKGIYHPLFTFRDVLTYILVLVVLLLILGFFYLFKWVNKKMVEKYNLKRQTTVQPQ